MAKMRDNNMAGFVTIIMVGLDDHPAEKLLERKFEELAVELVCIFFRDKRGHRRR